MHSNRENEVISGFAEQRANAAEIRSESSTRDPASAVAELSHEAWLRSGRPFPSYTRATNACADHYER